ncbi:MAG: TlyA family RNA methyltransferase [Lachnospirales bacterium]
MEKYRIDVLLSKKLNISREKASKIIKDEKVFFNNSICKCNLKLTLDEFESIEVLESDFLKYVSRAGLKLEKALEIFDINVKNKIALDVGSSTGGFTHCLLLNDIEKVYAVDTGTLQMDITIKENNKVNLFENTNILDFNCELVDIITIDVSFVSTTKIMEKVLTLLKPDGGVILLLKPQFEVGKKYLNKKGVVKDSKTTLKTKENLFLFYEAIGFKIVNEITSPILGKDGNTEFLIHLKRR